MVVDLLPAVLGCFSRMEDKPRPPGCHHLLDLSGSRHRLTGLFCQREIAESAAFAEQPADRFGQIGSGRALAQPPAKQPCASPPRQPAPGSSPPTRRGPAACGGCPERPRRRARARNGRVPPLLTSRVTMHMRSDKSRPPLPSQASAQASAPPSPASSAEGSSGFSIHPALTRAAMMMASASARRNIEIGEGTLVLYRLAAACARSSRSRSSVAQPARSSTVLMPPRPAPPSSAALCLRPRRPHRRRRVPCASHPARRRSCRDSRAPASAAPPPSAHRDLRVEDLLQHRHRRSPRRSRNLPSASSCASDLVDIERLDEALGARRRILSGGVRIPRPRSGCRCPSR